MYQLIKNITHFTFDWNHSHVTFPGTIFLFLLLFIITSWNIIFGV